MIISDGINHGKLQTIIVGELKKAGLKHRLKKIILKNVKDNKTVFGAPLLKVPSCSVICCGSTLSIPNIVTEMSIILRANANVEGLFRKAGSQARQKDIKRLLDSGGCVSEGHHPIDVASVLKLYLRTLPEPLISAEVQDLLLRCRLTAGDDALHPILHTLLLLPVLHVHLLHYIMELLNYIASNHKDNLMDSSNLAIVMAPSIMPLPAASAPQRLEHHVALVKMFIDNAKHIGILTEELMSKLDDDSEACLAKRKKRRSGSLNRVLHGLRKMVSGSVHTPATVKENAKTPILSKSAAKRKFDSYEGFSTKTRKEITKGLPQKELSFTPLKMGTTERKRLRLSMMDARSTPIVNSDFSSNKKSESSISSQDLLTSSEHLFSTRDTIDLSPVPKQVDKDYVRISKQEYEEIKSRVSAIENRLSREFTEPLQQVQNVYEQTLEEVAMLHCPTSDQLARRLSKELKIRPSEEPKIIRSPSARKIGSIRRRSKENITKIVRHKSWNISTQTHVNHADAEIFYPYIGISRGRTHAENKNAVTCKNKNFLQKWIASDSENSLDSSINTNKRYNLRKRSSTATCDYKPVSTDRTQMRRSLNTATNTWECTSSDNTTNSTLNSSKKSQPSPNDVNNYSHENKQRTVKHRSPHQMQQKWKSAATFFMEKTGELENNSHVGRPSVNKLRRQNAGAVLAKAKLFESSSEKSSERSNDKILHTGFARKPRVSGISNKSNKSAPPKTKTELMPNVSTRLNRQIDGAPTVPSRLYKQNVRDLNKVDADSWRTSCRKLTIPIKKIVLSPTNNQTPNVAPAVRKALVTPRSLRSPACTTDVRKLNTPMRAVHNISPRRRSPRQKTIRYN